MDENFLLHRRRALELLEWIRRGDKPWSLYVFSSGHALDRYDPEELVELGISWVWMGLEGEESRYAKLRGVDTFRLVRELQARGIRVLGSSIIGLEDHRPETIDRVIDYAVRHDTDFHPFMLYTPLPGTPLHAEHRERGTLLQDVDEADIHGQYRFNFRHPHISREQSEEFLLRAFRRDFEVNGPSVARVVRTLLQGWRRYRNHRQARIRQRFRRETASIFRVASGALWAMERYFRCQNREVARRLAHFREELDRELGAFRRLLAPAVGGIILAALRREERRLAAGWAPEPRTFVERRNWR